MRATGRWRAGRRHADRGRGVRVRQRGAQGQRPQALDARRIRRGQVEQRSQLHHALTPEVKMAKAKRAKAKAKRPRKDKSLPDRRGKAQAAAKAKVKAPKVKKPKPTLF